MKIRPNHKAGSEKCRSLPENHLANDLENDEEEDGKDHHLHFANLKISKSRRQQQRERSLCKAVRNLGSSWKQNLPSPNHHPTAPLNQLHHLTRWLFLALSCYFKILSNTTWWVVLAVLALVAAPTALDALGSWIVLKSFFLFFNLGSLVSSWKRQLNEKKTMNKRRVFLVSWAWEEEASLV